jgi:prepilin-type processing-associated H-X9-DG protein
MTRKSSTYRELVAALAFVALLGLLLIPVLARARADALLASCQNNFKQFALVFQMYYNESPRELYPPPVLLTRPALEDCGGPASAQRPKFMLETIPDPATLYPDYVSDPGLFYCPTQPRGSYAGDFEKRCAQPGLGQRAGPGSYVYFGFLLNRADTVTGALVPMSTIQPALEALEIQPTPGDPMISAQMAAWFVQLTYNFLSQGENALQETVDINAVLQDRIRATVLAGGGEHPLGNTLSKRNRNTLYPLRAGVERFIIPDHASGPGASVKMRSDVWVLLDWPAPQADGGHPRGANVLYLDGHTRFFGFPDDDAMHAPQPVNAPIANFLRALRGG